MYNYIFWVIYNRNINRNKSKWLSRHNASGVVFFAILVHISLLIAVSKKIFGANLDLEYLTANRSVEIIGVLLCILCVYLYYTKSRIVELENKFLRNNKIVERNNGWIVSLIIFIPLLLIIIMGWER